VLLITAALGAIAFGGWVVFADARRQLALAQKKTDFVSNVSHELKTPLTSIRMFAEMMQGGNVAAEKRPQYLRIIVAEAERLTRLINNVLDFARLERKQKRYDFRPLDLHEVLARTWEGHELHLREQGFTTSWQAAPPPYPVRGDEDALAQIIVNLLSNAEKYSADRKEIELHSYLTENSVHVSVLDRGSGVPAGEETKIFEAFYRAHDSLASGIQGSGLGLTLAQRLAKEHGGEITYQAREGGGSNVTLRLPLTEADRA
jgi:signal transduction histidine kinase